VMKSKLLPLCIRVRRIGANSNDGSCYRLRRNLILERRIRLDRRDDMQILVMSRIFDVRELPTFVICATQFFKETRSKEDNKMDQFKRKSYLVLISVRHDIGSTFISCSHHVL